MITIQQTNSLDENFKLMVLNLDRDLNERNGLLQQKYDQYNVIKFLESVFVALDGEKPIGCGCYKAFDQNTVEIKRMFVDKSYRGKGISKKILISLEELARSNGYEFAVLETGHNQNEAIGLYQKLGYQRIDNYGPYVGMMESLCFKKSLL